MIDRQKIKQGLTHGKQAEIARKAGVNESSVSTWFKGAFDSVQIEEAAIEVYAECEQARQIRQAKFEAIQNGTQA